MTARTTTQPTATYPYAPVPAAVQPYVITDASGRQVVLATSQPVALQHQAAAPATADDEPLVPAWALRLSARLLLGTGTLGAVSLGLWGASLAFTALAAALAELLHLALTVLAIVGGTAAAVAILRLVLAHPGSRPAAIKKASPAPQIIQNANGMFAKIVNKW
ncbi:hypothetical protein BX265_2327 [Streptomyces sp. TLI_235]|nr:hypothetical protein [Streptomyces sp. TLI_235]PBC77576.1 hypothetical protein BX265_2327 [Streptomyces sp. TLI_235]